jgi:hypothetical protein
VAALALEDDDGDADKTLVTIHFLHLRTAVFAQCFPLASIAAVLFSVRGVPCDTLFHFKTKVWLCFETLHKLGCLACFCTPQLARTTCARELRFCL